MSITAQNNRTAVFVIHGGKIEAASMLLAASLSKNYQPRRIIARIMEPASIWGPVSEDSINLLNKLEIEIKPATNEIDPEYPYGNKLSALVGIQSPAILLDSDIVLLKPFLWHYTLNGNISARPAEIDTFSQGGGSWYQTWSTFGLSRPDLAITACFGTKMAPYYNTGVISVRDADTFAQAWLDCAQQIDNNPSVRNKRPWLDQIALPVAAELLGWNIRELHNNLNFPAHLQKIDNKDNLPYFAHYHWPRTIEENPILLSHVKQLIETYPSLKTILTRSEKWRSLLNKIK